MTQLAICCDSPIKHQSVQKTTCYFILFLLLHTLLWSLGTYLARPALPHDTLEGITWGLQWQWGYSKHPYLTAWLSAAVFSLFNQADWSIYLLAQLINSSTFIAVWYLAKQFIPPRHAVVASLLLDGILFYNVNSFNLTSDTLQTPLWAFLILVFYKALTTEKLRYWLLTGFFAACCFCTKYQAIILFLCMLFFCLKQPQARACFKKKGVYCFLIFFFVLISPHLFWLYQHEFISLVYAKNTAYEYTTTKTIWGHLLYPVLTLLNDLLYSTAVFILVWPFYNKNKAQFTLSAFQWHFLLIIGLGPIFLTSILGIIDGNYFPPRWATSYLSLIGIILIAYLKPVLDASQIKKFAYGFILFSSLLFTVRMLTLTIFHHNNDAFLPNKAMALSFNQLWQERYHKPLAYLAGSNYLVALTLPYLPNKAQPFLNWRLKQSPWINESELRQKGALFVWDPRQSYGWDSEEKKTYKLPQWLLKRYPKLIILPNIVFYRLSNKEPIIVGVAVLPPKTE